MLNSKIRLHTLAVQINYNEFDDFVSFCDLLRQLDGRGFYQRLHLQFYTQRSNQEFIDQLASLDKLTKLHIDVRTEVKLAAFYNLQELFVDASDQIGDYEEMAVNLANLEQIRFRYSNFKHVSILMSRTNKLKRIIVDTFLDETRTIREWIEVQPEIIQLRKRNLCIDLRVLNAEREKLDTGRKITVYVEEEIYLATKWSNLGTDLSLVRLVRKEAFERIANFNIYG